MQVVVMVAGASAEIVGWWLVSTGRRDVWTLMPVVLGAMGVAAVLARPPVAAADTSATTALLMGLAAGLALYLGTRLRVDRLVLEALPPRRGPEVREAAEVTLARSLVPKPGRDGAG